MPPLTGVLDNFTTTRLQYTTSTRENAMENSMVKFYVGEMSSHWVNGEELHILERLDFVLSADNEKGIAFIDSVLRKTQKDFIRSDNQRKTVFDINILEVA